MKPIEIALNSSYIEDYFKIKEELPGKSWLKEIREQSIIYYKKNGFPTRHQEEWKYTPLNALRNVSFNLKPSHTKILLRSYPDLDSYRLVFHEGVFQESNLPSNVEFYPIEQVLESNDIKHCLNQAIGPNRNAFTALNTAFFKHGYFLKVPDGYVVEKPIHIIFYSSNDQVVNHIRNVLVLGECAELTVLEHFIGLNQSQYLTNVITEGFLGKKSTLSYYKLQQESVNSFHIGQTAMKQEQNSQMLSHAFSFGGNLSRSDLEAVLAENAQCKFLGLFVLSGRQHTDNHTAILHQGKNSKSFECYKGLLADESKGVFNGKIYVSPEATKSISQQSSKNVILSDRAEMNAKPQLDILTDDVQCTHGATVGQLDKEALFYLQTRGISLQEAQPMLMLAFAQEVLDKISWINLKNYLTDHLQNLFKNLSKE